jgi:hypothetical protein
VEDIERADQLVIDLDPGAGVGAKSSPDMEAMGQRQNCESGNQRSVSACRLD